MKMNPQHYDHVRDAITALVVCKGRDVIKSHKEFLKADPRVKNVDMRFRWDLFHHAKLGAYAHDELYPYLNDDHIDTALKAIVKDLIL